MQVSNNKLYVLATAQGTKTVKIFDMLGNQLSVKTFDGTRTEVNLAKHCKSHAKRQTPCHQGH